jgi:hypothetical protein
LPISAFVIAAVGAGCLRLIIAQPASAINKQNNAPPSVNVCLLFMLFLLLYSSNQLLARFEQ